MKIDKFTPYNDIKLNRYIISRFDIKKGYRNPNYYFKNLRFKINNDPIIINLKNNSKHWFRLFYSTNMCQELIETLYTISKMPESLYYVCNRQIELGYKIFEEFDGYNDIPMHSRYRGGYAIPITNFKDVFRYSIKLK